MAEVEASDDGVLALGLFLTAAKGYLLQARDDKLKAAFRKIKSKIPSNLYVGDFRDKAQAIPDASVDLVFTDPPYDRAAIPRSMAMPPGKRRILKPCGSMISYCGNLILPEALPLMMSHLKYFWICAVVHSEKDNEIFRLGIKNGWKPLLWFVKQHRGDVQTFVRDAVSGGREKDHHEWQQATSEAEHFITGLTAPNGIVVDFFAGGGTTLVAAEKLGRRWLAFEIDEMAVARIMARMG